MRKQLTILWGMLGAALSLLIVSNAVAVEYVEETETVEYVALEEDVVKTADNAIILLDASESMAKKYRFTTLTRYDMAKQELMARNTRLPNLGYNIGLYLYNKWTPLYPVQPFDRVKMADAIKHFYPFQSGCRHFDWTIAPHRRHRLDGTNAVAHLMLHRCAHEKKSIGSFG